MPTGALLSVGHNVPILHLHPATFVDATVKLTNNMTLECVYPKTDGITQMSWVKSIVAGKEVIAVSHPLYGVHIEDKYKDRIRFINASSRDKSLNFMKTTEADTGLYLCSITFPKGVWEKVVQVIQLDSFEVPVPPTNHMIIEPGGNVTLRCSYSVGDLVRQVMWERIKMCHSINCRVLFFPSEATGTSHWWKAGYWARWTIGLTQYGPSCVNILRDVGKLMKCPAKVKFSYGGLVQHLF
uniref:CD226 molecule n=1 Tax=Chelonoidis abingdonii TaxID=106734 RepID=A0A8C0G8K4_CHEAB